MARGLSDEDIAALRQQVADGKRPRVQLSGPHFAVGATGTVIRVGRPDTDGPDYLRVRVKVDNMTDELAFGPAELRLPGRAAKRSSGRAGRGPSASAKAAPGKAARATAAPAKAVPAKVVPAKVVPATAAVPAKVAPADATSAEATPAKRTAAKRSPAKAAPSKIASGNAAPAKAAPVQAPAPANSAPAAGPHPSRGTRRRTGPTQKVTFTVSSAGAAWTLSATRGSKNVAKNVALSPGVVGALADLLDQPALSEAIGEINDAARAEAEARAEQLRAELSQLEAVLATHTRP